jgi:hypothetical protein
VTESAAHSLNADADLSVTRQIRNNGRQRGT